jgi:type I restriction enzyme, S subunit
MTKPVASSVSELINGSVIPSNWKKVPLGEVGRWVGGGTPSRSNIRFWTEGSIPWVSPKDMKTYRLSSAQEQITEAALINSATNLVKKGSVLLVVRSGILEHTLPVAVAERQMALNQDLKAIEPLKEVDSDYLALALRAFGRAILRTCARTGTTVASLELPELLRFQIPIAPLAEQRRVVAAVEAQFTRLHAGVNALRRVQISLKRYRAAILKAACEGRLLSNRIELSSIPLRDLIEGLGQGWSPKCDLHREPKPDEWAIITTTAVQPMQYVNNQGKPLPKNLSPRPHIEIKPGDFLMTRKGPRNRTGVACLVRSTRHRLMVCDTVYRFRCLETRVKPAYLELALNSPAVVEEINRRKSGISDSGISLTHDKIGGVPIPLPPLTDQHRIVMEVERRLIVVEDLESAVKTNLQRAKQLQQLILNYAFLGKLGTHIASDHAVGDLSESRDYQRTMKSKTKAQRTRTKSIKNMKVRTSLKEALTKLPTHATLEQLCRTAGYNAAVTTDIDEFFQEIKAAAGKLFILKRSENGDVRLRKVSR